MNLEHVEQAAREMATVFSGLAKGDWSAIVEEAMSFSSEVGKLGEFPLGTIEPIFSDLPSRGTDAQHD